MHLFTVLFIILGQSKPPPGLHLDVVKGDKLIEKLIIDEKKYYLFGRNPDICDFTIDHQSCSRVHAALVYHKHLKRVFLIDLNSTGSTECSCVQFSAWHIPWTHSPRAPQASAGDKAGEDEELKGLLGLPEEETELENLTEFNTAHNKRISILTIEEGNLDIQRPKRKRKSSRVSFNEEEVIITPEDVDPSVGRFRNMVQTVAVKKKMEGGNILGIDDTVTRHVHSFPLRGGLYGDLPPSSHDARAAGAPGGTTILGGLPLPNPAPEVDLAPEPPQPPVTLNPTPVLGPFAPEGLSEPRKKKYAKEAWPGKKPTPSLLL
uniref:FHA domain-containing protein n=1 Tax=Electrophorus electricus TaxID=8005 RepID=A0AAY5EG57_ELEEL